MRSVLFITYAYPPNLEVAGKRMANFVTAAKGLGMTPYVLTFKIDRPNVAAEVSMLPFNYEEYQYWAALYRKSKTKKQYLRAAAYRLVYEVLRRISPWRLEAAFYAKAKRLILKHSIQIVLTSGPPFELHKVGCRLKQNLDINWIADFRDPWIFPKSGGKSAAVGLMEKKQKPFYRTLALADSVSATTKSQALFLQSSYSRSEPNHLSASNSTDDTTLSGKFSHIQNGVSLDLFSRAEPGQYKMFEGFNMGYLGDLNYESRDPRNILYAIKVLNDESSKKFHLHLWCNLDDNTTWGGDLPLPELVEQLNLSDYVHINSYVSYEQSLYFQQELDLLVVFALNQKYQIPAKTYEYILSDTPILGICERDSETYALLNEFEKVFLVESNEQQLITDVLREFLGRKNLDTPRSRLDSLSPHLPMSELFAESSSI